MIMYLKGRLAEKQPTHVIIDIGGIGYGALISLLTYDKLPGVGEECLILTHYYVREDRHELFGFSSPSEKKMFLMLIAISGVGPKLALSALSGMSIRELKSAIIDNDVKRLTSISGLGKKTAERIVMEMKHRLDEGDALEAAGAGDTNKIDQRVADAAMALIALGYKQNEASRMVRKVIEREPGSLDVEEVIRKALSS